MARTIYENMKCLVFYLLVFKCNFRSIQIFCRYFFGSFAVETSLYEQNISNWGNFGKMNNDVEEFNLSAICKKKRNILSKKLFSYFLNVKNILKIF